MSKLLKAQYEHGSHTIQMGIHTLAVGMLNQIEECKQAKDAERLRYAELESFAISYRELQEKHDALSADAQAVPMLQVMHGT